MISFSGLCWFDDLKSINVIQVRSEVDRAILFVPNSKTDEFGEGHTISIMAMGSPSCPVFFIKAYLWRLFWEAAFEGSALPSLGKEGQRTAWGLPVLSPSRTAPLLLQGGPGRLQ